jgi:hypothetical protein
MKLGSQAELYALATLYNLEFDIRACFVATAVQGTTLQNQIDFLRDYREKRVVKYFCGLALLKLYFMISIPLAKTISKSDVMMDLARRVIWPGISLMRFMLATRTP